MFANLKKKIESEVGDLSRLNPSTVLSRNTSTPLSSRHDSISSLVSESSTPVTELSSNMMSSSSSITPSRNMSLHGLKLKGLEEKLQTQESDFAWRLSNKDDEIVNLNKTIDILTGQLKNRDSEVQKKLVRVQEDIDSLEGFSQQENAKLKHLLLNKEEEMSTLKARVILKEREVLELGERVRGLEGENQRVREQFVKVQSRVGGEEQMERVKEMEIEMDGVKRNEKLLLDQLENARAKILEIEGQSVAKETEMKNKIEALTVDNAKFTVKLEELVKERDQVVKQVAMEKAGVEAQLNQLKDENSSLSRRVEELSSENGVVIEKARAEREELVKRLEDVSKESSRRKEELEKIVQENQETNKQLSEVMKVKNNMSKLVEELKSKAIEVEKARQQVQTKDGNEELEKVYVEINALQIENGKLIERNNEVEMLNDQLSKEIGNGDSVIKDLRGRVAHLEGEIDGKSRTVEETLKDLENARQQIITIESRNMELEGKVKDFESLNGNLTTKLQTMTTDAKTLEAKKIELEKEKKELENKIKSLDELKSSLTTECEELKKENNKLSKKVESCEGASEEVDRLTKLMVNEKSVFEEEVKQLTRVNDEYVCKIHVLETESLETSALVSEMRSAIGDAESKIIELSGREKNALANCQELSTRLEDNQRSIIGLKEKEGTLMARLNEVESRSIELQNRVVHLEKQNQDQQSVINDLRENGKSGLDEERILEKVDELEKALRSKDVVISELCEREKSYLNQVQSEDESTINAKDALISELDNEKSELLVQVSELQSRVDMLEEENKFHDNSERVHELERALDEKKQQLRQQAHTLSDLRRSLAKELKAGKTDEPVQEPLITVSTSYVNGTASQVQEDVGATSDVATLPTYETDVNFMYLRSVLFKYLTSSDPQITSHLTRVVATLLHLTEEETATLVNTVEARSNQHLLAHIIK